MENRELLSLVYGVDLTRLDKREVNLIARVLLLSAEARGLLDATNGGQHDMLSVTDWDAVKQVAGICERKLT